MKVHIDRSRRRCYPAVASGRCVKPPGEPASFSDFGRIWKMDNQALAEPGRQINHDFLDAVEAELALALQRTREMEAGLDASRLSTDPSWQGAFASMSANLADWHGRLAELTRQTAAVESELNEQEQALREWFQALGLTSTQLAESASTPRSR
jgi:hypothetical protein